MNWFPLVPLPPSLIGFTEMHRSIATFGTLAFGCLGTLLFMLWVPLARQCGMSDTTRDRIGLGLSFYGLALACLVFGLYAMFTLVTALVAYILNCIIRGADMLMHGYPSPSQPRTATQTAAHPSLPGRLATRRSPGRPREKGTF